MSQDKKWMFTGGKNGEVFGWPENTHEGIRFEGPKNHIKNLWISPDSKLLVSEEKEGYVYLWNLQDIIQPREFHL